MRPPQIAGEKGDRGREVNESARRFNEAPADRGGKARDLGIEHKEKAQLQ